MWDVTPRQKVAQMAVLFLVIWAQPPELGSEKTRCLVIVFFHIPSFLVFFMIKSPVHLNVTPPKSHPQKRP